MVALLGIGLCRPPGRGDKVDVPLGAGAVVQRCRPQVSVGSGSEDDEVGASVLDMDPEAQAVMEMMGKTFHSKVIREVDQDQERKKELEQKLNESN